VIARLPLRVARAVFLPLISILCAFVISGIGVALTGADPIQAFLALIQGAFLNDGALAETLVSTIPYLFVGLAVAVGFRAGLFNIGADGQLYMGGIAGAVIGSSLPWLPGPLHVVLALLGGIAGGSVYGALPGALKARFGAHEVITTIMLNYCAYSISDWLIDHGPLMDPSMGASPRTRPVLPGAQLPILLPGSRLHLGLILALVAVPVVWFMIERTTIGFRIRSVGLNQTAARAAGISVGRTIVLVMAISGGLAGLAGADEVLGLTHYMPPRFSVGYGFDAIAVALLARSNPWGVLPAALLFGAMRNGAGYMQLQTQVSADLISVVQAIVIMFVGAPLLVRWLFRLRVGTEREAQITQREEVGT
jgi:general nucleoside transport system permease protein